MLGPVFRPRFPVVLASESPRRRDLLSEVFDAFDVAPSMVQEHEPERDNPWRLAEKLALDKAQKVFSQNPECLVIAGDTVVALPDEGWSGRTGAESMRLLAKPRDTEEAEAMLSKLSGRTHVVVTGVALLWPSGSDLFSETSQVTFRKLKDEEIRAYVATGRPLDKAGAYGLQDDSQDFIEHVEGPVSNVIGLPKERLIERIERRALIEPAEE